MSLPRPECYRFIDLFAGIGGFHVAFNETGRARCVFASEWDPAARKTYRHNFLKTDPELFENNDQYFGGDITDEEVKAKIRKFDILCGGFPCQPFSQAGRKLGFKDARGTLFYEIEKIIREHEPKAIFLENVRGLLTHDGGRTFRVICNILKDCGYHGDADWPGEMPVFAEIVRASDYGLPQHRPRLFMAGFRSEKAAHYFSENLPKTRPLRYTMSDIMNGEVTYYESDKIRDIGFTLRCGGRGSGVHDRRNWDWYVVDGKPKQIFEKEGLLMQGFVTKGRGGRKFSFPKEVPLTQRMKQLGNSVAVDAVKAWADAIINALDNG
jgi:DNA (cytosine-5)-methyltransferase 1